jgi:ribokinase
MDLVIRTRGLPRPGETVLGSGFATSQGGKGANQAIAAARAGGRVAMIGAIGTDAFGDRLAATLSDNGVDITLLRRLGGASGIAVITVDDNAENTIVVAAGANALLAPLTTDDERAIRRASFLLMQLEVPIETVTAAARVAAAAGVPVLLNPSPVRHLPSDLLDAVTVLVVNEGEAATLGEQALSGVPHLVTTLGAAGARYRGPDGVTASAVPPRVQPVDTTGAGDTFAGALAVAWAAGADPPDALRRACAAGALATTRPGAGVSAPTRAEIDDIVDRSDR